MKTKLPFRLILFASLLFLVALVSAQAASASGFCQIQDHCSEGEMCILPAGICVEVFPKSDGVGITFPDEPVTSDAGDDSEPSDGSPSDDSPTDGGSEGTDAKGNPSDPAAEPVDNCFKGRFGQEICIEGNRVTKNGQRTRPGKDARDPKDRKKKDKKGVNLGTPNNNWFENNGRFHKSGDMCNRRYGAGGCELVTGEDGVTRYEAKGFDSRGACSGDGSGDMFMCFPDTNEETGETTYYRSYGRALDDRMKVNELGYQECLGAGTDAAQCDAEWGRGQHSSSSYIRFWHHDAAFAGWIGYDEKFQTFIDEKITNDFQAQWYAGRMAGGIAKSVCNARRPLSSGSDSGLAIGQGTRTYAHVEGEYSVIEVDGIERPYVYKFTFAVDPAECEIDFEFYVDDGSDGKSDDIHIFLDRNSGYEFKIGGEEEDEDRFTPGKLSWAPGAGHPEMDEWTLLRGKYPHDRVCLRLNKASCLKATEVCSTIKKADQKYQGGYDWGDDDGSPGSSGSDPSDDDDDDNPGGPSLNPDL